MKNELNLHSTVYVAYNGEIQTGLIMAIYKNYNDEYKYDITLSKSGIILNYIPKEKVFNTREDLIQSTHTEYNNDGSFAVTHVIHKDNVISNIEKVTEEDIDYLEHQNTKLVYLTDVEALNLISKTLLNRKQHKSKSFIEPLYTEMTNHDKQKRIEELNVWFNGTLKKGFDFKENPTVKTTNVKPTHKHKNFVFNSNIGLELNNLNMFIDHTNTKHFTIDYIINEEFTDNVIYSITDSEMILLHIDKQKRIIYIQDNTHTVIYNTPDLNKATYTQTRVAPGYKSEILSNRNIIHLPEQIAIGNLHYTVCLIKRNL